jgi:hypothetical protein
MLRLRGRRAPTRGAQCAVVPQRAGERETGQGTFDILHTRSQVQAHARTAAAAPTLSTPAGHSVPSLSMSGSPELRWPLRRRMLTAAARAVSADRRRAPGLARLTDSRHGGSGGHAQGHARNCAGREAAALWARGRLVRPLRLQVGGHLHSGGAAVSECGCDSIFCRSRERARAPRGAGGTRGSCRLPRAALSSATSLTTIRAPRRAVCAPPVKFSWRKK